ncbi:MAG: InlB B-repeat-containing protein [Bifidobacterium adolescentis]
MKRLISLLAALACLLGAFVAPFASADDTAADAARLPDHIVNGDFEYHEDIIADGTWSWKAVIPATGENFNYSHGWQPGPSDWDESRFGWHSTQNCDDGGECRTDAVELQTQKMGWINTCAEIVAAQADTSIYQDIRVVPGNTYHWSLKHQSIFAHHVDRIQVLIGEPGKETPQQATRTKANGGTDGTGDVGTDIATTNITDRDSRNWETYEGDWTCPEGVTVARFTFKSIDAPSWNNGNLVDDIGFSQSTTLRYDANGGTGAITDQTVGVGVNAYTATDGYTLAGHGLASWNTKPDGTGDSYKPGDMIAIDKPTTLYAQWADTTQTAMPETGGTVNDHYLLKTIWGVCLFGLILMPLAWRRMRRSR